MRGRARRERWRVSQSSRRRRWAIAWGARRKSPHHPHPTAPPGPPGRLLGLLRLELDVDGALAEEGLRAGAVRLVGDEVVAELVVAGARHLAPLLGALLGAVDLGDGGLAIVQLLDEPQVAVPELELRAGGRGGMDGWGREGSAACSCGASGTKLGHHEGAHELGAKAAARARAERASSAHVVDGVIGGAQGVLEDLRAGAMGGGGGGGEQVAQPGCCCTA